MMFAIGLPSRHVRTAVFLLSARTMDADFGEGILRLWLEAACWAQM